MRLLSNIVLAASLTVLALAAPMQARAANASAPINVVASNWKFAPGIITVHAGTAVTLQLSSTAGVHGIMSSALGIPQTIIMPGKTVNVTFTPTKPGTYAVPCSIPCGPGHDAMILTIKVV